MKTLIALIVIMTLAFFSLAQTHIKKPRQEPKEKPEVSESVMKSASAPSLTPNFKKAAKLALRTLDRQRSAAVQEAGDYARRKLECDNYPMRCGPHSFEESASWEAMQRDSDRAMAEAEAEKEAKLDDDSVFRLLGWYRIRISNYLLALKSAMGSRGSRDEATNAGTATLECSSYIGKFLDGEEVGTNPCIPEPIEEKAEKQGSLSAEQIEEENERLCRELQGRCIK